MATHIVKNSTVENAENTAHPDNLVNDDINTDLTQVAEISDNALQRLQFASTLNDENSFDSFLQSLSAAERDEINDILNPAPIETAAGEAVTLVGGGGSNYNDDLGSAIDLLSKQGVIDPTELEFGLIASERSRTGNSSDQLNGFDALPVPFLNLILNLRPFSIRDQGTYGNQPITLRGGDGDDVLVDTGIIMGDGANNVYEISFAQNLAPTDTILLQGFPAGTILNQGTMIPGSNGTEWEVISPFTSIVFSADNSWVPGSYTIQASSVGLSSNITITHQTSTSFGDDHITGGTTDDTIFGDDAYVSNVVTGNDIINGDAGNDTLYGDASYLSNSTAGNDQISGGTGDDLIFGDAGTINDSICGEDIIYGDDGNDRIYGDSSVLGNSNGGDDILYGGNGDDLIVGDSSTLSTYDTGTYSGGNDTIYGGSGNDTIYGDAASQNGYIQGFGFNFAKGGNDIIDGGDGDDIIYGDSGFYAMSSGSGVGGDDIITGGRGNDSMYGVDGNDRFVFRQADIATNGPAETDTIKDFKFDDVIDLGDLLSTAQTVSNLDQYLDFSQGPNGVNIDIDVDQDGVTDHTIILENLSLSHLSGGMGTSDTDILTNMLNQNALDTLA
ncbi:type I secretion C-terminal target domain-containing protein [Kiloniella antarctica]|uniref:Type I secretion C-terminal target domain-containing protein n=1 Tax=Kiloniella antarctica TaxID=1550907 RepID=A0ABW5BIN1_9PROT